MKKLLFSILAAIAIQACNDSEIANKEKSIEENHQNHVAGDFSGRENQSMRNEMVHEMEEMMTGMHSRNMSGNNDRDYAEMMSDHHDGAVEMSELLLRQGKNGELKDFARKVIDTQTQEIELMDKFDDLNEKSANRETFQKDLQTSMVVMMNSETPVHNDVDKDYAQQMIPHHESAVKMAKVYKNYGKQKDLLKLSDNIIATQTKEIAFLKDWLARN